MEYEFFVPGEAKTAGSKKAFINPKTHKIIVTHDNPKTKDWMDSVKWFIMKNIGRPCLLEGPVELILVFYRIRPASHFGSDRNAKVLKPLAPRLPISKPDSLKLGRAIEDAMTGIIYKDDSQVCHHNIWKVYCSGDEVPGVKIIVREIEFQKTAAETIERYNRSSQLNLNF
jgi:Holliday junction resolvase RusA-like endonuclease